MYPSLPLLHPSKPEVPVSAPDSHLFHPGWSQVLRQLSPLVQSTLSLVFAPMFCHQHPRARVPDLGSLSGCKDYEQHKQGSPRPGLPANPLGAVVLVWVSAGQDPFELEERSKSQIPSWPQHPWRGGAYLFSQWPGLLRVLGRGCSRRALMFLSAIPLSCFFKRCRFPYKLLPERSDKPLQVKLYLRCGPEGALKNMAHAIRCIYLNYSGESRGRHWDGAGKRGLRCLIGVHI